MRFFAGKANSIVSKLRLALLPPFVLAALFMAGLFSYLTFQDLEQELTEKQTTLADIYATALSDSVWNLDQSGAEAILAALSLDPDVAGAVVREQFSGVLATVGSEMPSNLADPMLVTRSIRSDIDVGGENIGEVSILFHKDRITALMQDAVLQVSGLLILLMAVLSFSVTGAIHRFISEPLDTLLAGIRQTQENHGRSPVQWKSDDEFGIVINAYNNMLQKLNTEEQALISSKETAEKANRAKSVFLATMSHELRTPLNGITGLTQLMEDTGLNDKQEKYLTGLRNSSDLLLNLVNDILDFSKIEAGAIEVDNSSFNMQTSINTIEQLMRGQARTKNIEIKVVVDAEPDDYYIGDRSKLIQVITNLAGNAVKFTEEGYVTIAALKVEDSEKSTRFRFEVTDTGIGIAEDKMETLFKPFTQVDATISRRFGGTGLGLAISSGFVEAMGGDRIYVESEEGIGAQFWFELTLEKGEIPAHLCAPAKVGTNIHNLNILVVEDNKINRTVANGLISKMGHKVTLACDGQEGVEAVENEDFDLILMDIHMPKLNGLEATKKIRSMESKIKADVPILAMTADVMQESIEEYQKHGMQGYVGKPVRRDELIDALAPYVAKGQIQENVKAIS